MKKFIALSLVAAALLNGGALPALAFDIRGDSSVIQDGGKYTVSNDEEVANITVSAADGEDLVLRLFSDDSLVYTDVITALEYADGKNTFTFYRPDNSEKICTAIVSGKTEAQKFTIEYEKPKKNNTGGGGGGGGTPVMSDDNCPWDTDMKDIVDAIKNVNTEKKAIEVIKGISKETEAEEDDIAKKEEISNNASNTVEAMTSDLNAQVEKVGTSNNLSLGAGSISSGSIQKLHSTLGNLKSSAMTNNVQLNRDLFAEYIIKANFNANKTATITISRELLDDIKDIDTLTVMDQNFRVSYDIDELEAMMGDKDSIDIKVDQTQEKGDSIKKMKIDFNTEDVTTMKVSFPYTGEDTDYVCVVDENGNPVGGRYNPLTGCIEAKVNAAGIYSLVINEKDFIDIKEKNADIQEAIKVLAAKGIIEGTSATEFSPDSPITRAEIAALMLRIIAKNDMNEDGGFADVKPNNWYFGTAGSSKKYGLINGYEDNTFRGDNIILNDQLTAIAARMLRREMKYITPTDLNKYLHFADASSIADWAREDVALARMADIVLMNDDNMFYPTESMTRGNAALIIKRMFDKIK